MRFQEIEKFRNLTFDDFRRMANDDSLTQYEKIGFPNAYREGKESLIFADIARKLTLLLSTSKVVLDIGPGCSGLATMIVDHCRTKGHNFIAVDSAEMLQHLPNDDFISKRVGRFPNDCEELRAVFQGKIDVILAYSVFHYVYAESNPFAFLDAALALLSPGGQMLIGDIPNISKRRRFFSSDTGVRFHQAYTNTAEKPPVAHNCLEPGTIDDGVLLGMIQRCRLSGFDGYLVPQADDLPMANRREDLLVIRP